MKTFPALYIDSQGELKYNMFPEEPQVCMSYILGHCLLTVCKCHDEQKAYEATLAAAKQSAITFTDKEVARKLILATYGKSVLASADLSKLKPGIYQLPEGWRVEVKEACSCDSCPSDAKCEYCQQPVRVAVLIPPSQITEALKEQFTIQRRP